MATNDTLVIFTPLNGEPPRVNNAKLISKELTPVIPVLVFRPDVVDSIEFGSVMPSNHNNENGVRVTIAWSGGSSEKDIVWKSSFKSFTENVDNIDTKEFAAAQSKEITTRGGSDVYYDVVGTFDAGEEMDYLVAGEYFRLKIERDTDDVRDDDDANDMYLLSVEVSEWI